MRVVFTRLPGWEVGGAATVPDDLGRALVLAGHAEELPLPALGGPGFDPGSEILVPEADAQEGE